MRSTIKTLLAISAAVYVSAAPYEKRWTPRSGIDIHIEWPGSGGGSSSAETPGSSRWPISKILSNGGRWPFSGEYGAWDERSPPPTATVKKRSYLNAEERALSSGTCDLQNAIGFMNLDAVSPPLPEPAGLTLFQVTVGRGTQNYTCDLQNATATPVPVGAVATLYNFSCVAAQEPALLKKLPEIAINQPLPTSNNTDPTIISELESGHHYFVDSTTPFFNLDTAMHQYGMGAVAKVNASDAPADACPGPYGKQGLGAVQWLRLDQMDFAEADWKAVYRLNTAGGSAPKMCTGQPASFEIPYAAEYWIFK